MAFLDVHLFDLKSWTCHEQDQLKKLLNKTLFMFYIVDMNNKI